MMRPILIAAALLALATGATAQQLEPTRLLPILQQQRNMGWDAHAQAEARAAQLLDENVKLKAEIEELKKKLPADAK